MNNPSLDTWTIIFFLAAIQGLFLGGVITLHRSRMGRANQFLGAFIILFSLMLLDYFSYWSNYRYQFPTWFGFSFGFPFWYGPVLYFYIRALNGQHYAHWKKLLPHFIPGLLFYVYESDYYLLTVTEKVALFNGGEAQTTWEFLALPAIRLLHMITYAIAASLLIRRHSQATDDQSFFKWQRLFVSLFALYIVSSFTYYFLVVSVDFQIEYDYMISMTMMLAIYTIGYLGYRNPQILNGFNNLKSKYERSTLKQDDTKELIETMNLLLEEDKVYRRNDLKLQDMANLLELSSHQLSQLVNEHLQMSFPDLINSYRVEEVKRKLLDPEFSGEKILGIAFDAGFNNKANFNNAFKKYTGMSPSEYRKLHQLEFMN